MFNVEAVQRTTELESLGDFMGILYLHIVLWLDLDKV